MSKGSISGSFESAETIYFAIRPISLSLLSFSRIVFTAILFKWSVKLCELIHSRALHNQL